MAKKMTNADRIRAMTDDELFDFIDKVRLDDIDYACTFCDMCENDGGNALGIDCDGCLRRWLTLDASEHPQGLDHFAPKSVKKGFSGSLQKISNFLKKIAKKC